MNSTTKYTLVQDDKLLRAAASACQGRQFWTGPHINEALKHLRLHPNDVCLVPWQNDAKRVLLGGPIPPGTLVDATNKDFSDFSDSFDVGEMAKMTKDWFQRDFNKQVQVSVLENGEMVVVGPNSKLISLSRQTPALLDMATTENGVVIGQYSTRSLLGHSGDCHSAIGGVNCLHHEAPLKPSTRNASKLFILAGYNSKPLKAWRDSRVFWIVYDPDLESCWLVPHNLSHEAVGDTVSATMSLVSKSNNENSIHVFHLSRPVQASLAAASPLRTGNASHREFLDRCMASAIIIDWSQSPGKLKTEIDEAIVSQETSALDDTAIEEPVIDRRIALYDGCADALFGSYPTKTIPKTSTSLSTKHGPLKILAQGCCARSRVVVVDASVVAATSEIGSVATQPSGVVFVKTKRPDIYDNLHMVRWNTTRGAKTSVIALTSEGCRYLCGPLPPHIEIDDCPTPVSGVALPVEVVQQLIEFALSPDSDEYFGALYQPVPTVNDATLALRGWMDEMADKDFRAVLSDDHANVENAFDDAGFRQLMLGINVLSVSNASAVERNTLATRIAKFLRAQTKRVAERELDENSSFQKNVSDYSRLKEWTGDNMDWALTKKDYLEEILKEFSVKVAPEEGVQDIALQTKLDSAIQKKKASLLQSIRSAKQGAQSSCKKIFNSVFNPALEALMGCIGENPRYKNYFREIVNANVSGIIIHASQSSNKQSAMKSPEEIMKIFHELGATGFISFKVNFLQTWKAKVINHICVVDEPGKGFNDPKSFVPLDHRIEDGPEDPASAYETDIRHQFVLPIFSRLPKSMKEDEDDDDDDNGEDDFNDLKQMPVPLPNDELAEFLLMRREFVLRDPEQGTTQPLWRYADWLFHQIKTIHQVGEAQAAPLVIRALGYSISQIMTKRPEPDSSTRDTVASIIQAINFISARGSPLPHAAIDTFFNMESSYVPLSKELERNPWQIEVVNILGRAVDYIRPSMVAKEYAQIRSNFQRAAANMVKRQIVQKLLDHMQEERKKNEESHEDYIARVNSEFYPAYREIVETLGMLLDSDPQTFELTNDLRERIDSLHHIIVSEWSANMRRCRVGPVREMVTALKEFSKHGSEAMSYLISRKPYLKQLYDQVFHIKYESCDQVLIEEMCKIIRAKGRNPEHAKHETWLARVEQAIQDVSSYDKVMSGYAHGNLYKSLPTSLMLKMLRALKEHPEASDGVTFAQVQELLAHIHINVKGVGDLYVERDNADGKKPVLDQLRGAWWMCPDIVDGDKRSSAPVETVPEVALIPMGVGVPQSSNVLAVLGDTYHKFGLARFFSGNLGAMRSFIRENYKFHLEWFEDTLRTAGLPRQFDRRLVQEHEIMAIYAVAQRLVHELVQDGSDRGDRARDRVYGEVMDPLSESSDGGDDGGLKSNVGLLQDQPDGDE